MAEREARVRPRVIAGFLRRRLPNTFGERLQDEHSLFQVCAASHYQLSGFLMPSILLCVSEHIFSVRHYVSCCRVLYALARQAWTDSAFPVALW
jgi:hypothetical protein